MRDKDELKPYYSVVRTDGQVLTTVRQRRWKVAMERWGPGTWLGWGDTAEEAESMGKELACKYREKQ
jgi:Ser/Thr protein kinase RdoA (MazF antagonist)